MDSFQVAAEDTEILERSHLVQEMDNASRHMDMFPVLIGTHVGYFHRVDGGYHKSQGYHVVNFVHEVQGPDSPPNKTSADTIEAHIDDIYFWLEVESTWEFGDYPDQDFVVSAKVTGYQTGPYSFSEELTADADKRETEHQYDG